MNYWEWGLMNKLTEEQKELVRELVAEVAIAFAPALRWDHSYCVMVGTNITIKSETAKQLGLNDEN